MNSTNENQNKKDNKVLSFLKKYKRRIMALGGAALIMVGIRSGLDNLNQEHDPNLDIDEPSISTPIDDPVIIEHLTHDFTEWYALDEEHERRDCQEETCDVYEEREHSFVVTAFDDGIEYLDCSTCDFDLTRSHTIINGECVNPGCDYKVVIEKDPTISEQPTNPDEPTETQKPHIHDYREHVDYISNDNGSHQILTTKTCTSNDSKVVVSNIKEDCKYNILSYNQHQEFLACELCGHTITRNHNLDAGVVNANGDTVYHCTHDGCGYTKVVPKTHEHSYTEKTTTTSNNNGTHTTTVTKECSCGEKEIVSTEKENCSYIVINYTNTKETIKCSECGHTTTRNHNLDRGTVNANGDTVYHCTHDGCGYKKVVPGHTHEHEHSYTEKTNTTSNNNGTHTTTVIKECSCGDKQTVSSKKENCSYTVTNYTDTQETIKCSVCGHTTTRGHHLDAGVVNANGDTVYHCTHDGCGYTKVVPKPVHQHSYTEKTTTTSNNDGTHTTTVTKECSCGDKQTVSSKTNNCTYTITSITDDHENIKCSVCGHTTTRGHNLVTSEPVNGVITITCSNPGCTYHKTETVACDHVYEITSTEKTANGDGTHTITVTKTCKTCGDVITETTTDNCNYTHTNDNDKKVSTCSVCGDTITHYHSYTEKELSNGDRVFTCDCGHSYTVEHTADYREANYHDNGDGTHSYTVYCDDCGHHTSGVAHPETTKTESCSFTGDGLKQSCVCGAERLNPNIPDDPVPPVPPIDGDDDFDDFNLGGETPEEQPVVPPVDDDFDNFDDFDLNELKMSGADESASETPVEEPSETYENEEDKPLTLTLKKDEA